MKVSSWTLEGTFIFFNLFEEEPSILRCITKVAMKLSIRNSRNFAYNDAGTRASMEKDTSTRMIFFSRLASFRMGNKGRVDSMSAEERHNLYTSMADEAFDEEEDIDQLH